MRAALPTDAIRVRGSPVVGKRHVVGDLRVAGRSLDLSQRPVGSTQHDLTGDGAQDEFRHLPHLLQRWRGLDLGLCRGVSARPPCLLAAIKPRNVQRERGRFVRAGFAYNPRFEYANPADPVLLARYAVPSNCFLPQAVSILERTLSRYGSYEHFEQDMGGDVLSPRRIWAHVRTYMEKEGCLGEVVVSLHDDLLSRASMTVQNGRPTLCINTAAAREHWLEGMLQHEIGTHFLRGLNGARQPWGRPSGRRRFALRPANPTEEGLASVHSVLHRRDPLLWRAALLYYAVSRAAHLSFSALFAELGRFVRDPSTRWEYCLRAKRGQEDTSVPGCFNKDQVYLTGVLAILRHRRSIDFQMLYTLGKVSIEDVERLRPLATAEKTRLPHFLRNPESYQRELDRIISANGLSDSELLELMPD
ncbi:putative tyrosine carboxypeptidase MATCAP2 isoform X1 [Lampetra fluviatilis]